MLSYNSVHPQYLQSPTVEDQGLGDISPPVSFSEDTRRPDYVRRCSRYVIVSILTFALTGEQRHDNLGIENDLDTTE